MVIGYLFKEDVRQYWIKGFIFHLCLRESVSDSHNTRPGHVKHELQDLKKDVNSSLPDCRASIDTKFDVITNCLNAIEENFLIHINDIITKELNESVISIKDSIIDALKEENFWLQQKFNILKTSYQMLK